MRYIFMISGYMGSGKDHFADYVINKIPGFRKYSIANELKNFVAKKYKFNVELTKTQDGKKTMVLPCMSVRDLLIKEAKEMKEIYTDDIFISNLLDVILIDDYLDNLQFNALHHLIIPDFRYSNEYDFLLNNLKYPSTSRIVTIRINRFDKPPVNTFSETQLDNFNFTHVINNKGLNGSISEYENEIDKCLLECLLK